MREWLGRLALIVAGLLAVLLSAEIVARLTWSPPGGAAPLGARDPAGAGLPEIKSSTALVRPGQRGVHRGVIYETNQAGFRGPAVSRRKPPGTFRIALAGDSIAMGYGVRFEDTYGARTERSLNDRNDGRRYQVLNLGVSGYSARSVLERFFELGRSFQPDLIVYGFTLNDIESPAYRRTARPPAGNLPWSPRSVRSSPSYLWRILGARLESLRDVFAPAPGSYVHTLDDNYFHNPEAFGLLEKVFDEFGTGAGEIDVCVLVLVHTKLHYLGPLHPFVRHYQKIESAAVMSGLHVAQTLPYFRGESSRSLWIGRTDSHPNARGHEILAGALLDAIDELPSECRATRDERRRGSPHSRH